MSTINTTNFFDIFAAAKSETGYSSNINWQSMTSGTGRYAEGENLKEALVDLLRDNGSEEAVEELAEVKAAEVEGGILETSRWAYTFEVVD